MISFKEYLIKKLSIEEEAPTTGVSNVDGIGVGDKGEPGITKKMMNKYKKKKNKEKEE